jgi:uncharacterized membrane protein
MSEEIKTDRYSIRRVGAILHKVYPIRDSAGKLIQYVAKPLKVELRRRDLAQILVGASILAIPVGFTQEVWTLGAELPLWNVVALALISVIFIALYVYFTFYRDLFQQYRFEYVKRVVAIYVLTLALVASLLTIIQVAPWGAEPAVAIKRVVIVAFPASMSAALSGSIS